MAEFRYETDRLILRDWREEDAADFHRLHSNPDVMATLGGVQDFAFTVGLIADLQARAARNGGYTFWALELKGDRRVIGFCGLNRATEGPVVGELEIGWRLARDCWGVGYAQEAARSCLAWAAEHLPGECVVAVTSTINRRSRRLMERIGMTHRAELDYDYEGMPPGDPLRPHVTYVKEPPL